MENNCWLDIENILENVNNKISLYEKRYTDYEKYPKYRALIIRREQLYKQLAKTKIEYYKCFSTLKPEAQADYEKCIKYLEDT